MSIRYYQLTMRVSVLSIIVNLLLVGLKAFLGIISHSISLLSDALHSLSDMITTFIVIGSVKASHKPPDKEHPFGHGRMEDIGGYTIALIILLIGWKVLAESFSRLLSPVSLELNTLIIIVVFITAVVKLALGVWTSGVAVRIDSSLLKSDAFHHYSDFWTSICVGVGLIFVKKGFVYVDALGGIGVSLFIISLAIKLARSFMDRLVGKKASPEVYERVKDIVGAFSTVKGVHDIEVHSYGKNRIISFHIEMDKDLSLEEAHSVADGIEKTIYKEGLGKCIVHIDLSFYTHDTEKKKIESAIKRLTKMVKNIKEFHALEIISTESASTLNFHLVMDPHTPLREAHRLSHRIAGELKQKFGFSSVNVHVEPSPGSS